jgi:hypothetical protein
MIMIKFDEIIIRYPTSLIYLSLERINLKQTTYHNKTQLQPFPLHDILLPSVWY